MSRILEVDSYTGVTEKLHADRNNNKIIVEKIQDVEPIIAANKKELAANNTSFKGDLHKVASIPMIVVSQWGEELKRMGRNPWPFAKENRDFLMAKLNNRDYSHLRTKSGRL